MSALELALETKERTREEKKEAILQDLTDLTDEVRNIKNSLKAVELSLESLKEYLK